MKIEETEGDTFSKSITLTDEDGEPIDLSGWAFYVTVKESYDDSDANAILSKTVTSHDDPANGQTSFLFDNDETEGLQGRYVFEVKFEEASGNVETIISTRLIFKKAVKEDI